MNDRFIAMISRLPVIAVFVLLLGGTLLQAQDNPPRRVPPPAMPSFNPGEPPSFAPPPPPPGSIMPLPAELGGSPQSADDEAAAAQSPMLGSGAQGSRQQQVVIGTSRLVDPNDPRMREVVGLIKIPEMGRNEVLEMLENFTRKPILRQQSLPAVTLTFFSQEALTRGEAISAIESLLALNGIAIAPLGDKFLKAIPISEAVAQVPRVWEGSTLEVEPSQSIFEKLFELDFLTTDEASALLSPLLTSGAPLAFDKSNRILITDALINLQRVERFLAILDKPAAINSEMIFFTLQNIRVEDALRRLNELTEGPLRRQLQGNTTYSADERSNQIIAFTHPSNAGLVRQLVERLDVDVAPKTATKVYSIRYADATNVVSIIEQVVSGQRQAREQASGGGRPTQPTPQRPTPQAPRPATAQTPLSSEGSLQFSNFLTIVPDERANTIVASGTHSDLEFLDHLIGEIDTLLAQVRIEVVITEVRLEDSDISGLDSFGFTYNPATPAAGFNVTGDAAATSQWNGEGSFYGVPLKATWGPRGFGINFVLETAQSNSNVTVLSAPTIVTTHNKEASVSVGEERPVITGVFTSNTSGTVGTTTQEQVQFKDIKLELKVTPLIGSDGVVQMEIEQQIQSVVGDVLINGNLQPVVGTRSATSFVSVNDGDLIVLGGLQSLDSGKSEGRMAVLGRIPVLGDLFKSNNVRSTRNELLIFIRPTILRTTADANRDARDQIRVLEGAERIENYLERGTFRPPVPESSPDERPVPRRFK